MNKFLSSIKHAHHSHESVQRTDLFLNGLKEKETPPESIELGLEDLTSLELEHYERWWKDLDPFCIGTATNQNVFKFISTCGLSDVVLEQIFSLFQDQKEIVRKEQFFAILRLIAHAQNGRKINKDLIYLGAPLPKFEKKPTVVHTHSRSRSAPQNLLSSVANNSSSKGHQRGKLSMDFGINNNGQGLLLTQEYKPEPHYNPYKNPFETDDSNATTPVDYLSPKLNAKCNSDSMPPPPVPSQSTKPPYPKYARRL